MSNAETLPTDESKQSFVFSLRGIAKGIRQFRQDRRDGWRLDLLSFRPLHDRGGAITRSPQSDGPRATLARIELNVRSGRPPDEGLEPDQLNRPGAP